MQPIETIRPNEIKDESIEQPLKARGAGAIFHILDTDKFMFFLRDNKDTIQFPNMVDIIGGHMDDGETPLETALREFEEELDDLDTGEPFRPSNLTLFRVYVDDRQVEQNIFGCELSTTPNLYLKEGQCLVLLTRDELANTDFAFNYKDVINAYAATV